MKRLSLLFLLCAAVSAAPAAPLLRDLGQGLVFCRVHTLPGDLPTDEAVRRHPWILDVRYVAGDRAAATALTGWLKFHASAATPVLLLANAETSAVLLAPFTAADAITGLIILGPARSDFTPDIAVTVKPGVERRAYHALETGAAIASLITEKVDKVRNDEAMLAREHLPDSALSNPPEDSAGAAAPAAKSAPPLLDPVLQRAVQLHRTLIALKRISAG
jgi:hypothetical protein